MHFQEPFQGPFLSLRGEECDRFFMSSRALLAREQRSARSAAEGLAYLWYCAMRANLVELENARDPTRLVCLARLG